MNEEADTEACRTAPSTSATGAVFGTNAETPVSKACSSTSSSSAAARTTRPRSSNRFRIVSRTLSAKETGSLRYTGPVVGVPDNSPGSAAGSTVVYLTVYVCPGSPACTVSAGKLSLRVRVSIYDPTGLPAPPSRQMTVQSWAVQR